MERIFEAFFQIQPARPVPLVFERAIAYFSEPVEEDRSRQPISSLTFIKACSHAPTQGWVFKPCEHEERPLDSTDLGSTGDEQPNAVYHAEAQLKLNETKSAVARPQERKFPGFSFTNGPAVKRAIAPKALDRFKDRIREVTRPAKDVSIVSVRQNQIDSYRLLAAHTDHDRTHGILLSRNNDYYAD